MKISRYLRLILLKLMNHDFFGGDSGNCQKEKKYLKKCRMDELVRFLGCFYCR